MSLRPWFLKQIFCIAIDCFFSFQEKHKLNPRYDEILKSIKNYLEIVKKSQLDMVPKAIKLYIIDELEYYIESELPPILFDPNANYVSSNRLKNICHCCNCCVIYCLIFRLKNLQWILMKLKRMLRKRKCYWFAKTHLTLLVY